MNPLFVLATAWLAGSPQEAPRCPVLPDEPARAEHSAEFQGRRYVFCCEHCVEAFRRDPRRYAGGAPTAPAAWYLHPVAFPAGAGLLGLALLGAGLRTRRRGAAAAGTGLGAAAAGVLVLERLLRVVYETEGAEGIHLGSAFGWQVILAASLPGLLAAWAVLRFDRLRCVMRPGLPACAAAGGAFVLAAGAAWKAAEWRERHRREMEAVLNFRTFDEFGRPPRAPEPAARLLERAYYRGNDERAPQLFNGGDYRTCAFRLSAVGDDGRALAFGDRPPRSAALRLRIERARNTKAGLFASTVMERCYLTRDAEGFRPGGTPPEGRVPLRPLREGWVWEADVPLPVAVEKGEARARGVVYLCESREMPAPRVYFGSKLPIQVSGIPRVVEAGARLHYALEYDLRWRDGRLTEDSGVWMGSLYRTMKFTRQELPYEQWFSDRPIPEVPAPSGNVTLRESPDRED